MTTENKSCHKGTVLVVDDTPTDLHLLSSLLTDQGFSVRSVPSGKLALQAVRNDPPELILLDIDMPEMDGYAVCRDLKADEELEQIPVLFISALNATVDKVHGFHVGGVDYITKPFQFEEVLSRVETHLRICRLQRELKERYQQLKQLETLRDNLTKMIVHDMRSPIMGITGNLEMLWCDLEETLSPQNRGDLEQARNAATSLIEMVSSLLDVSRLEADEMPLTIETNSAGELLHAAQESLGALVKEHRIRYCLPEKDVQVVCDGPLTIRIIANLLANAVKFTPVNSQIDIACEGAAEAVRLSIADTGPGIPPECCERVFDKFAQVEGRCAGSKWSTGLGLTFCKLAVEAQGGQIGVDSTVGRGSVFWFTLPANLGFIRTSTGSGQAKSGLLISD